MRLRAIAVGIAAVAGLSALAAAEEIPTTPVAGTATVALTAVPAIAPPARRPRPIPFLPALAGGADAFRVQDDEEATIVDPLTRRSTVLREAAIAGAAIGVGFLLDDSFEPGSGEGTAMDNIGQFMGSPFTLGAGSGLLGIGGSVARRPRTIGTAKRLVVSIGATMGTVALLKISTDRERPDMSDRNSFPSGHSAASFAAATVLDRRYGGAVGWTAYGLAGFVAASRVVGNRHFFSDVMAGAVIGRFFGRIFTMHH